MKWRAIVRITGKDIGEVYALGRRTPGLKLVFLR